jgi:hypothetical protein
MFGIEINYHQIINAINDMIKPAKENTPEENENEFLNSLSRTGISVEGHNPDYEEDEYGEEEDIYEIAEKYGLDYNSIEGSYLGLDVAKMQDHQTLGEFKDQIVVLLKKMGIERERKDIQLICEGGFDG